MAQPLIQIPTLTTPTSANKYTIIGVDLIMERNQNIRTANTRRVGANFTLGGNEIISGEGSGGTIMLGRGASICPTCMAELAPGIGCCNN